MAWDDDIRLVIGMPTYDGDCAALLLPVFDQMDLPPKRAWMISSGVYCDRNRNDMIKAALDGAYDEKLGGEFTHFLMIDSDSIPKAKSAVRKLVEAGVDMIYGVTCCGEAVPLWMVFDWSDRETYTHQWRVIADPTDPHEIFPKYKDAIFEVDGGGTGMCLIKREVLEGVEHPWYATIHTSNLTSTGQYAYVGDDVFFHRKVQDAGFKIYAHGGVFCYHKKSKFLFPDFPAAVVEASINFNLVDLIGE